MVATMSRLPSRSEQSLTRADLDNIPDDGFRYELIDGLLVVSAAPGRLHQRAVFRLATILDTACPPEFEMLMAPFAAGLATDTEIQPTFWSRAAET